MRPAGAMPYSEGLNSVTMKTKSTEIILVNERDDPIGTMEKCTAHMQGRLHRAFSLLVFNTEGKLLLQRRAFHKYHSGGLWSNTCCGHPSVNELLGVAAHRRLREELDLDCEFKEIFSFVYTAEVGSGLVENEYDHVLVGHSNMNPRLNYAEAIDWRWAGIPEIQSEIANQPEQFTAWFGLIIQRLCWNVQDR